MFFAVKFEESQLYVMVRLRLVNCWVVHLRRGSIIVSSQLFTRVAYPRILHPLFRVPIDDQLSLETFMRILTAHVM